MTPVDESARLLITLGILLILGVVTDVVGRCTALPRVTLLLLFGFAAGPGGVDLLAEIPAAWFPRVADVALLMVGFLLGESFTRERLREQGRAVIVMSLAVVAATIAVVSVGLWALGAPLATALLLGAIASATDPAATTDVVHEVRARGPFTRTLLGVVAIDDAWGLVAFSILLAAAQAIHGGAGLAAHLLEGGRDLGGAVLVGVVIGVPMARLTGRIRPGEPTLVEALGLVLLCGGVARWLDVSFLLAAMTMGAVVANLATHHTRPFHAIEGIEWPFLVLFFVLSGALIDVPALLAIGTLGLAYVVLRTAGRVAGGLLGARVDGGGVRASGWMGLALLPQAGVAVGMALVAIERFPAAPRTLLPVVVGSTVIFELIGPICARLALRRAGEASP